MVREARVESERRGEPRWLRCIAYSLGALTIAAAWVFVAFLAALGAALGENNGSPPESLMWVVMAVALGGGLALLVAAVCAGIDRGRAGWWALSVAGGCLATWVPLLLLLGSDWS